MEGGGGRGCIGFCTLSVTGVVVGGVGSCRHTVRHVYWSRESFRRRIVVGVLGHADTQYVTPVGVEKASDAG